tara:strand:+ start:115 stop:336 length:222 start_codon:yes stop_codon:yes gene_type:complete
MTKIWRKNEWEQLGLFPEKPKGPLKKNFKRFVFRMFDRNCRERREHGQEEYKNVFRYYRKNHDWLEEQYKERT